jgi:hypothetical protein
MMNWLLENRTWLFSGIAVAVPLTILGWVLTRRSRVRRSRSGQQQTQSSGSHSSNVQAMGPVSIRYEGSPDK